LYGPKILNSNWTSNPYGKVEGKIYISVSSITGMPGRTGLIDLGRTSSLIITAAMDSKDTHYDSYIALWNLPLLSLARRVLTIFFLFMGSSSLLLLPGHLTFKKTEYTEN